MRYVAAYLLAVLGKKSSAVTAADVEKILSSVGIEVESDKVKKVISELNGKDLEEIIAEGSKKLASVPSGGVAVAGGGGGGGAAAPAASAAAPAAAADKKEEKKKEESEESEDDMGFGLFD